MPKLVDTLTDAIVERRIPLLLLSALLVAISWLFAPPLEFDRSIENMFASNDEFLEPYRDLTATFGTSELIILVYEDEELFAADGSGLQRAARLSDQAADVEGVSEVISIATIDRLLGGLLKSDEISIIGDKLPGPQFRELFTNLTHSHDGKTASIICMLESGGSVKYPRQEVVSSLRQLTDSLPSDHPEVMLAGEPVMVVDGFRMVEKDGRLLIWSSTILLSFVILACFRSLRWVVIPIAVVQFTLITTRALLAWSGIQLSMVSSMFAAIITVIGVATIVHLIVRFREGRDQGLSQEESLKRSIRLLIVPICWACLTDAAGFLALTFSAIGPVQDFGLMMTAGSIIVLLAIFMLVPALALTRMPSAIRYADVEPQHAWNESLLDRQLATPLRWIEKYPSGLTILTLILVVLGCIGLAKVKVESDFTKNFRQQSELVTSYKFVESRMGGAGVWDIMIPADEQLSWEFLSRINQLQSRLREEVLIERGDESRPALSKVLSLFDALEAGSPIPLDNIPFEPVRENAIAIAIGVISEQMPQLLDSLHAKSEAHDGQWYYRIMLRSHERQSAEDKLAIIQQVNRICREEFGNPDEAEPEVAGLFVLLTHLVDSVLRDQWLTFSIATLLIGMMMLLAFRHPILALVGLLPNVFTIVIVMGALGWSGIRINMGAAMIAAVSMGLSIDSSIHYITAYRRARQRGASVRDSLDNVQDRVGRALVFSTLALIVGFSILCLSEFVPTIYFGALVGLSMLGGLLGNLLVLPLCLRLLAGRLFHIAPIPDSSSTP